MVFRVGGQARPEEGESARSRVEGGNSIPEGRNSMDKALEMGKGFASFGT